MEKLTSLTLIILATALSFNVANAQDDDDDTIIVPMVLLFSENLAPDNERKDGIIIESVAHELIRDSKTGEIKESIKVKRKTDEASVELVRAFLDGTRFAGQVWVASGDISNYSQRETVPSFSITEYSQTTGGVDDGMEEFTFCVKRAEEESALLLPAVQAAREAAHSDPDSDVLPEPEPMAMLLPAIQQVREAAYAPSSDGEKGGNAETTWKVEKGEK